MTSTKVNCDKWCVQADRYVCLRYMNNYACMQGCIPMCMRLCIRNHACATMYMYMLWICNYAVGESQGLPVSVYGVSVY